MDSYLRFNVPAVNGPITAVRLRLYAMDSNGDGFNVHSVADNSWDELTINSGNAPALGGVIASYGATTANSWLEIDLTGYVNGGGQVSLGLSSGSGSLLRWRSREHANAPELIIEVNGGGATATPTQTPPPPTAAPTQTPPPATATPTAGPSPTPTATAAGGSSVTFTPEADSFTFGSQNNGGQTILRAQGGGQPMTAYLRFNAQNLSGAVTQAVLRLYVMDSNSDGFTVNSVADNSWGEMTINSSNAPAVGDAIGSYGATTANTWIDVDITGYVTGNGLYSLALTSGTANTLRWRSREHANAPQLIITTSGGSANSGQTEYVSWRGYSGSAAYPTATPGGRRPLKRGPSEPRWRPGEAPNLEANKNNGHPATLARTSPSATLRTSLGKPNMDANGTIMGEVGYINDTLTDAPQTVILNHTFRHPVVFVQPPSRDGETAIVRITDVQPDRFTLYIQEAPDRDGPHTTEAVSYLVLEAGVWQLGNDAWLEVGQYASPDLVGPNFANSWSEVTFSHSFAAAPVVISQVQSNNDPAWVKTRQRYVSAAGFSVALEGADAATTHGAELIGWLAITPGSGVWNNRLYEAGQTANNVTHAWQTLNFSQNFTQAPRLAAGITSYNGGDGSYLRYSRGSLTAAGVSIMIEEDTTWDSETDHTAETVAYLAVEGDGSLTANGETVIQRVTYSMAGQPIAVRVTGDPAAANNGLHYLYADHLGGINAIQRQNGTLEQMRYTPF
ncbi:MAG TPA: DNRLRE domain-containing protein, partial [Chloroflexi bacterium]|nr:DNRLRE domain-containing protein [Chloroflexota bacterium]